MSPEALSILNVFKASAKRTGEPISLMEFGNAIIWHKGFIRDEPVRLGFVELLEAQYVFETPTSLELTAAGDSFLYGQTK